MNEKEMESMAGMIAEKLVQRQGACRLTIAEQQAVKDLIRTKANAIRAFLWICGALALWILKDVYGYIIGHLALK